MRSDRDPFEDLRLDEGFVRAARFIEPSAAERMRGGDAHRSGRCQVVPVRRGVPGVLHWLTPPRRYRPQRRTRVVAVLALILGLVSLGVLLFRQTTNRAGHSTSTESPVADPPIEVTAAASTSPAQAARLVAPPSVVAAAAAGVCLDWEPSATGAVKIREAPCSQPHQGEVTKVINLADQFPAWPGRAQLDALTATECAAALPGRLDPPPPGLHPRARSLHVPQAEWRGGSRVLVCLLANGRGTAWSGSAAPAGTIT